MLGLVVGLTAGLGAAVGPAQAEKVGVAAAVNPDAFSSLSGTPNKQLSIGKNIFYSERINTTASGLVQVLLLDGSTFTVGPNSDLVIDKFVYDPKKKTGEMIATFSKGTMRFIGGKLSKNEGGVTVKTPSGALAIRGGMFQGSTSRGIYSFLYGHSLTFSGRNGQSQTIFQPGYSFDFSGHGSNIRPTTRADINAILVALTNKNTNWQVGGNDTARAASATPDATNFFSEGEPDEIISTATATRLQDDILNTLGKLKTASTQTPTGNTTSPNGGTPGGGTPGGEEEPPVRTFNGYAAGFRLNGSREPSLVANLSPQDFQLALPPDSPDGVTAGLKVKEFDPTSFLKLLAGGLVSTSYDMSFGGATTSMTIHSPHLATQKPVSQHGSWFGILQRRVPLKAR
ncbi:hypothetical protein AUC69_14675 [Methyloceanibacter superfactus]|uniref:FecR protein domain-containing protein n=1 Tax=Methyloceanibacter superfactus TaxID=1774969 RepID=A0A1E3VS90_9HYPH|nr:FecR domain-containing protein [Methyloceanibacter superfactus]ODR96403.1 hypothetical protein AUC69_14675 [Methyloceanibacter superfactus]